MQRGLIGDLISVIRVIRVISVIRGLIGDAAVTVSSDFTTARGPGFVNVIGTRHAQRPINCGQWAAMRTIVVRLRVTTCVVSWSAAETRDAPILRHGRAGGARKGVRVLPGRLHGSRGARHGASSTHRPAAAGNSRGTLGSGLSRPASPADLHLALASAASFGTAPGRTAAAGPAPDSDSHPLDVQLST